MNNYFFEKKYKSEISSIDTIKFIDSFYTCFFSYLKKTNHSFNIFFPIISSIDESLNITLPNSRQICFDNIQNKKIYQITTCYDNYFSLFFYDTKNKDINSIISSFLLPLRDPIFSETQVFNTHFIHVENKITIDKQNHEYFYLLVKQIWEWILSKINNEEFLQIYKPKHIKKEIAIQSIEEILKKYPSIPFEKAMDHFITKKELVFITNPYTHNEKTKSFMMGIPSANDFNSTSILYVKNNNRILELIKISSRPSGQLARTQQNNLDSFLIEHQLIDNRLFDEKRSSTLGITINFTNLMLYILKKIHPAEVTKNICDKDFVEFCDKEGIEIL